MRRLSIVLTILLVLFLVIGLNASEWRIESPWTKSGTTISPANSSDQVVLPAGSESAPSLAFGDGDSGLYESTDDSLRFVTGGVESMQLNVTGNHVINSTLDADTGDEIALSLNYTVNKITSGNDIGLYINMTDTNSPGESYFIRAQTNGADKFYVKNDGYLSASFGNFSSYVHSNIIRSIFNNYTLQLQTWNFTSADNAIEAATGTFSHTSGEGIALLVKPAIDTGDQVDNPSYTALAVDVTETSVDPDATNYLLDLRIGGISKASVKSTGDIKGRSVQLSTTDTKPTCDSSTRGTLWFTQGGAGVKDSLEVCAKDATDTYAWRTLY